MERTARLHRSDLEFAGSIPVVRLHGDAALAARELDEVWLPLLMTGYRNVAVTLDGLAQLTPEVIAALSRVLTHVRGLNGEMALVTTRPEFVEELRHWDVEPAVPVLLDLDSATAVFQPADASPAIDRAGRRRLLQGDRCDRRNDDGSWAEWGNVGSHKGPG